MATHKKSTSTALIPQEIIERKIFLIRGKKVMFDRDLAELYGVTTKRLNEQVKRNVERFPADFMYLLTREEVANLRSQFATSSYGGRRYLPYAFTEHGVAMLSSVLNSPKAIQVNIQIIKAFIRIRNIVATHKELQQKFEKIENEMNNKFGIHDEQFAIIFKAFEEIKLLLNPPVVKTKRRIGFHHE